MTIDSPRGIGENQIPPHIASFHSAHSYIFPVSPVVEPKENAERPKQ
jgi:hypothetical protein